MLILGFLSFLCGAALLYAIYNDVAQEAKEKIKRGAIDSIVFSESPVYYDDGETVLGVFFDKTHRRYIEYKSIPPYFIKALVATEDKTFFTHPGFDVKAILRAMIANYRAGRIAQGGSTLTQQTAKNIFSREKKSYRAKVKELMEALLLEREYSKEEILEMYINQFFVTGIGRGLRIAAQYFFDKEAEDLDLVECAFHRRLHQESEPIQSLHQENRDREKRGEAAVEAAQGSRARQHARDELHPRRRNTNRPSRRTCPLNKESWATG